MPVSCISQVKQVKKQIYSKGKLILLSSLQSRQ